MAKSKNKSNRVGDVSIWYKGFLKEAGFVKPRRKIKKIGSRLAKTEIRRYSPSNVKAGQVKSVSYVFYNTKKMEHFPEWLSDRVSNNPKWFYKILNSIYYKGKDKKGETMIPYTSVVVIEERDDRNHADFRYEPYTMMPPATKLNIFNHVVNSCRNHSEFIRLRIKSWGYKAVKYDFSNFKHWFVPSIRLELIYE